MKTALRWLFKGGAALVVVVLLATIAYVIYGRIAWRDLPVEMLEARYGGDNLAVATTGSPAPARRWC
jgi:hypothetical protein